MKKQKTNTARLLDKAGVTYSLVSYCVDENDLSAGHLMKQLGEEGNTVFKTLVLRGDKNGCFVCVIPGMAELDLKKAAKASGNKKCELLPIKDLFRLTGYVRGGCSPLCMKKKFPTFMDESAIGMEILHVSAGIRGLQLRLAPDDLLYQMNGSYAELCQQ